MNNGILIISIIAAIGCIWVIRKRGFSNLVYPSSVFIFFALADVLVPSILWSLFGQQNNLPWLSPLTQEQLASGLIYYIAYYIIFLLILIATERSSFKIQASGYGARIEKRLMLFTLIAFALNAIRLTNEITSLGGLANYALVKSGAINELRISGESNLGSSAFDIIPFGTIFLCLAGVGFYFRKEFKRHRLFTYIIPIIALIFAVSTFYRGSILNFMFTFLFVEYLRQRSANQDKPIKYKKELNSKKFILIGLLIIVIFSGYGAARDAIRSFAQTEVESNIKILPGFLKDGHGLLGVSHIVVDFGVTSDYLIGKTYFDMLMLPVPRFIYTDKPVWYGIDDITKAMGWPQSTQSAVTMPGEAYANFGIFGLAVAIPYAVIFALILKIIRMNLISYLLMGPLVIFMIPTVVNWMSFTGLMNSALLAIILYLITFLFPRVRR